MPKTIATETLTTNLTFSTHLTTNRRNVKIAKKTRTKSDSSMQKPVATETLAGRLTLAASVPADSVVVSMGFILEPFTRWGWSWKVLDLFFLFFQLLWHIMPQSACGFFCFAHLL